MAQFNITLDSDLLHGLFTGDGKDQSLNVLDKTPKTYQSQAKEDLILITN